MAPGATNALIGHSDFWERIKMRASHLKYALSVSLATALLTSCGALSQDDTQPPIGAPGTQRPSSSSRTLVYAFENLVGGQGALFDYPSGKVVTRLQQTFDAAGACSDKKGDVFAAGYGESVEGVLAEYAYGATSPTATFQFSSGGRAFGCSVDSTTGNVAAIIGDEFSFSVAVVPNFPSGSPKTYTYAGMGELISVGYDDSGNLFLLGVPASGGGTYALAELPKGGSSFEPISVNLGATIDQVETVQWDGKYLTIEATVNPGHGKPRDFPHAIYRLSVSGSNARVVGKVNLDGLRGDLATSVGGSWIQRDRNIVIFTFKTIRISKYPAGGKEIAHLNPGAKDYPAYAGAVAAPPTWR
jgi:hypothetical protein